MENFKVFVYGTLKKGFVNHSFLSKAEYIGPVVTKEKYPMYIDTFGTYPYLLDKNDGYNIKGELYIVDEHVLKSLDWLEGCPDYYKRKEITVLNGDSEITAYCYFFVKDKEPFDQTYIDEFIK